MTTWNSADKSSTVFLSSDALTANATGTSAGAVRSTDAVNTGKLYLEFQGVGEAVGLTTATAALGTIGPSALGALIYQATGNIRVNGSATGVSLGVIGSETIGIAVDFATSRMWVRLNAGLWNNSGSDNPATGTGGLDVSALFPGNAAYAVATFTTAERSATVNFGANTFAHAAPSGFAGWYAPPTDGSADAGLTQTLAALTLSGYGVSGTLSTTQARLTQVALEHWIAPLAEARLTQVALELWGSVATTTVGTGLLTATFSPATLTATSVIVTPYPPIAGSLTRTLGPLTLVAAGRPVFNGLAPFTFQNATLVATATLVNHGVLDQTLAALVLNPPAVGVEKYGSLDAPLAPLTLAGVGTSISGRLDAILGALMLAGTGSVAKKGKLERTLAGLSLTATGALANRGVLGGGLGPMRMLALGGLSSVAPGTPGVVSAQTFFFAWTDEASEFSGSMLREDEQVFGFELTHEEGDFATLRVDLKNPRVGLLAAGRNVWCWFSWRDPSSGLIEPLIHGRLIGIPENIQDEVVRLQFVARPSNYIQWKKQVAEGLKVRPFWDPVWISEGQDDPDTVLEARPSAWHIDRVSLDVTASDTVIGEDGTLLVTADDHFYDGLKVSYGDTPLRRVDVTGTVTWTQQGSDFVDLTWQLWQQFRFVGNPYEFPIVSSFTGEGLMTSWPKAGASIGGGWSMDPTSGAGPAAWQQAWLKSIVYVRPVLSTEQEVITPGQYTYSGSAVTGGYMIQWKPAVTRDREYVSAHETVATVFPLVPIATTFRVRWEASRDRTEIVKFAMVADTQPLLVDPGDDETDTLELSSDFVSQGVDPGGALPLGDLKRNSYFNTDRGNQSVEYLIMLARAKILARARAVNLTVETPFAFATRLSCRWNATIQDPRLPGGEGTGKVTSYTLSADGDSGELKAEVTVACTIGRGNIVAADPGEATYGDGYTDEYQAVDGATLDPGTRDIVYESFDGMQVLDDDGLDLFRMTPDRVVRNLTIENGPDLQQDILKIYKDYVPPGIEQKPPEMGTPVGTYVAIETPTETLSKAPTTVSLELEPIGDQSFETTWEPAVSALMVPRTIDLEAPYV